MVISIQVPPGAAVRPKRLLWRRVQTYATLARIEPSTFRLQAAGAGADLPEEWHTFIASQASTLAALLSRMPRAVAIMCRRYAPAARWQALAAEAESSPWII
jgi:hypothetical protein